MKATCTLYLFFNLEKISNYVTFKSVRGFTPKYGKDCFFAENATIIGQVIMGDNCSVWYCWNYSRGC